MPQFSCSQLATPSGGTVAGDAGLILSGFAPADSAKPGDLTFAENDTYFSRADQSAAAAILVSGDYTSTSGKTLIRVANARTAFAHILPCFSGPEFTPGIHPPPSSPRRRSSTPPPTLDRSASSANVSASVPAPSCRPSSRWGDDCVIERKPVVPNVTVYPRSVLGRRVRIPPGRSSVRTASGMCSTRDNTARFRRSDR